MKTDVSVLHYSGGSRKVYSLLNDFIDPFVKVECLYKDKFDLSLIPHATDGIMREFSDRQVIYFLVILFVFFLPIGFSTIREAEAH